jgi:hypothetical protein
MFMYHSPTVDEIRNLGFEWPKNILIEQYCVMHDGPGVDLFRTIGKLMKARSEINDVLEQFKRKGDWEQEREIIRQGDKHNEVIGYLRRIQAAWEKRELEPTDLLLPIWPHLGIPGTVEVRELTNAEVGQLLESSAVRCAWTDAGYAQLHLISRQEVEQRILPHLFDPGLGIPYYGYLASEWHTNDGETIVIFCLYYVNL